MLYHAATTGPSAKAFRLALALAIRLSQKNGSHQVAIAVAAKSSLDGVVSDSIGKNAAKTLRNPNGVIQVYGITLYLMTKLISSNFENGVILATHVSTEFLDTLLTDRRATDLIYLPWTPQELAGYLEKYKSTAI